MSGPTFVEDGKKPIHKQSAEKADDSPQKATPTQAILNLQGQVGNRAVQRMLAQRSGDGSFQVDEDVESRINQERGGGQPVDTSIQTQMEGATGHDFSGVRVHNSPESDNLNQQLGAKAFTTGSDIFFRSGQYSPGSSAGQELLAHEMTHVVQQSTGMVSGGGQGMRVNAPGDAYEQQADQMAKTVLSPVAAGEEPVQRQVDEDEEEEDGLAMTKRDPALQRQEEEDKDELAMKRDPALQRQEEEDKDELAMKRDPALQRQEEEDKDELAMKRDPDLQRQNEEDEEIP